jgi:hypothetical protein
VVVTEIGNASNLYSGVTQGLDSFRVTKTAGVSCKPSGISQVVATLEFDSIDEDSAFATLTQDYGNCTANANNACQIVYTGSASRLKDLL